MKRMVHWSDTRETSLNPRILAVIWSKGKAKYGIVLYNHVHIVAVDPMSLGLGHTPRVKSLGDFLFFGPSPRSRITPPNVQLLRERGEAQKTFIADFLRRSAHDPYSSISRVVASSSLVEVLLQLR